jgi:exosortase A
MASILPRPDTPTADASGSLLVRYAPLIAAALAVGGILVAHADTVASIVLIWNRSETFAHGYVVVPICLWLAWRKRDAIAATAARPWYPALLLVAAAGALWMVMEVADVVGVRQFALAFMLQAAIVAVVGLGVARVIAFPLLFLLFAVPAGEFMVPTLIDWTADFTVAALRFSGVPVFREANHFVIPSGAWSVVEACSGLRYLIASVMIGVVYATVSYRSARRRAAFIAASVIVPLLANWLRAYMIVMIGHLSNNKLAVGVDHLIYGWVFFGIVMALLFWVGSFWSQEPEDGSALRTQSIMPAANIPALRFYAIAVAAIVLAAVWRPLYAGLERAPSTAPVALGSIAASANWSVAPSLPSDWVPDYSGFVAQSRQGFVNRDASAGVHLAYYRDQRKGHELVTSGNQLVLAKNDRWKELARDTAQVTLAGRPQAAHRSEITGYRDRLVVYRLYWVDGRLTDSDYAAKAMLAWSRLRGGTGDAALVVVFAQEREGLDVAREALEALWPSIERTLLTTRGAR